MASSKPNEIPVGGAKSLWQELSRDHSAPLLRARDAAKLTIPSIMPPEGSNDGTDLPTPYQSLGARGVNNLASKMLLALFPPGSSPFRYTLTKEVIEGAAGSDTSEVEKKLSQRENDIMDQVEASPQRPILGEYILHLIVCGNACFYYPDMTNMRMYRLDQFRVRRNGTGKLFDAVVFEKVNPQTLEDNVKTACGIAGDATEDVEVYTRIAWRGGKCEWWQEINDLEVPGTRSKVPETISPWIFGRWKAVPGQHYGRGHVTELIGDLISYEGLSQALIQFAAVAAKIVFLAHPAGSTRMEDVNNAESGDTVTGNKEDIDVLQLEKSQDFQVSERIYAKLELRLSQAFLLQSGTTRSAERVTAEEIRATAQELEDVNAGSYTVQSQDLQMPWVNRTVAILEKARVIPLLPKGTVKPIIVTGFQALGRNHALNKVRGFMQDLTQMVGPQAVAGLVQISNFANRIGAGWGVDSLDELIKTQDQIDQEQAAARQQEMAGKLMDKAAGPMAKGVADGTVQLPPGAQAALSGQQPQQ